MLQNCRSQPRRGQKARRAESLVTPCKNPNGVSSLVTYSELRLCLEEELCYLACHAQSVTLTIFAVLQQPLPEGWRSMTTQKILLIRRIRQGWCVHAPPSPLYLRGGSCTFYHTFATPSPLGHRKLKRKCLEEDFKTDQ